MSRSFLVICQLAQKLREIQITQNLKGKIVNHFCAFYWMKQCTQDVRFHSIFWGKI